MGNNTTTAEEEQEYNILYVTQEHEGHEASGFNFSGNNLAIVHFILFLNAVVSFGLRRLGKVDILTNADLSNL